MNNIIASMQLLQFDAKVLLSLVLLGFIGLVAGLYNGLVAKPRRLRSLLTKQGINGPPHTILLGNILEIKKARGSSNPTSESPTSHNCAALLFPFFEKWRKLYGIYMPIIIHLVLCLCHDPPHHI